MAKEFSRHVIMEYLPEIRAIIAPIEIEVAKYPNLDDHIDLYSFPAKEQYGQSKLVYAMLLLGQWLDGTPFNTEGGIFHKKDKKAEWNDMLAMINAKIMEYHNGESIIEITISKDNRVSRSVNGTTLAYDFDGEMKPNFIRFLMTHIERVKTSEIQKYLGSESVGSVFQAAKDINSALRVNLFLPKTKNFIDGKRISGYRIDPCYNVIPVK